MTYIEYGTWEEQADYCYKIIYNSSKIDIIKLSKTKDSSKWIDNLKGSNYISSIKFPTWADAYHYLKKFVDCNTLEVSLKTKIQEFINSQELDYTHILDYVE
jgi:hypothetical protein